MTDEIMNRTQKLENYYEGLNWDQVVRYDDLDCVDHKRSNSNSLYVIEPNESKELSYKTINCFTNYIHDPLGTVTGLMTKFPEIVEDAFAGYDHQQDIEFIEIGGKKLKVINKQGLVPLARFLNEIEKKTTSDLIRYYVTPYARLVRKNYNAFSIDYTNPGNVGGYFAEGPDKTKVIYREQTANSVFDH